MKESTINMRLANLATVLKFHKIPDYMNPLKGLRRLADPARFGRDRIVSDEELNKILALTVDKELYDYYIFLRYTGARADITAARLMWADISLENEIIHVPKDKNKGKKGYKHGYDIEIDGRLFPTLVQRFNQSASLTLQECRKMYPFLIGHADSEILPLLGEARKYIFPSYFLRCALGNVSLYSYAGGEFRKNYRSLGIDQTYLHDLRRTAGTEYYQRSGGDIVATRDFLGHTDIGTTQKYLHIQKIARHSLGVEPVKDNPFKKSLLGIKLSPGLSEFAIQAS
jgi:integrase